MTDIRIEFTSQSSGPAMTIHPDGRITLGDDAKPTEAAAECVNAMSDMIRDMISNAVQAERDRVIGIIKGRIDIANGFINGCMDHEVQPAAGVLGGLVELRSLLRELQQ